MKAFNVTLEGSYYSGDKIYEFSDIKGVVPLLHGFEEGLDYIEAMVRKRLATIWFSNHQKKLSKPKTAKEQPVFSRFSTIFVNVDEEPIEHDFSFIGKDVRELSEEEMQLVAIYKGIREIPTPSNSNIRTIRNRLYGEYSKHVNKVNVEYDSSRFMLSKQPPIIIEGEPENHIIVPYPDSIKVELNEAGTSGGTTVARLREIAEEYNRDISGLRSKNDILDVLLGKDVE